MTPAPPFWDELATAVARVPGAMLTARDGYAYLTMPVPVEIDGLSERTATLLEAFTAQRGVRKVGIDIRNAQWAAMAVELLERSCSDS